jgi:hypothetical protein
MKNAIVAITLVVLLMTGLMQARTVVILSPEEIAVGVQRAVKGVPLLRSAMKDPDSFVLEGVHMRAPNKQGISDICYSYRARNSFGGYSGTGTARLNSKDVVDDFVSRDNGVGVFGCSLAAQAMMLDITTQVKSALAGSTSVTTTPAEQAKRAQAYADCLKLAVDNSAIVCKQ